MKHLLYILCTIYFLDSYGQELQREVTASEGNSIQIDQLSISYTVGQPIAGSNSNIRFTIAEGFQRGFREMLTSIPKALYHADVKVYPNPTQNDIYIKTNLPRAMGITAHLYNLSGQIVMTRTQQLPKDEHLITLDVRNYSRGQYLLVLLDSSGSLIRTFYIQKHL